MAVGFGFSVGDFIAALELVSTVIDALRDSGTASTEYRELLRQLYSLETALLQVKRLEVEDAQQAELIALRQAASQCQRTIDEFWHKIQKHQPHLVHKSANHSRLKDKWMRIKWAVCTKDDVAKFKADLVGHTESIHLLLSTIQMGSMKIQSETRDHQQRTISGRIQDSYFKCMQKLTAMSDHITNGLRQSTQLLEMTTHVLRTNVQVFQIVKQIQDIITRIPGQIDRQQPVFLIDALGRTSPFHLEFVRSPEALIAVLAANFEKYGAASKIQNREFAIEDSLTKQDVNFESDWDLCFFPGQRVEMSMIFEQQTTPKTTCPRCKIACEGDSGKEIEW